MKRIYALPAQNPLKAAETPSGREVTVALQLTSKEWRRYVVLEEPFPAGCEVVEEEADTYGRSYAHREVWDDKVLFYFSDLKPGTHRVTYRLRTETPGLYHLRPATAHLLYFPEVRGNTGVAMMRIGEHLETSASEHALAASAAEE